MTDSDKRKTALFAGGCFWCMEKPFDEIEGVIKTVSGYAGGHIENPTYEQVSTGRTGHREVIQVTYDPDKVDYRTLLDVFWRNIDPFDAVGQFCDKGQQYTAAVFTADEEERQMAGESKAAYEKRFGHNIETAILPKAHFYPAEAYHQKFYKTNPGRYQTYAAHSGRAERLGRIWGAEAGGVSKAGAKRK